MTKIVLTGAAGRLGSWLREPLTTLCDELVSSDIVDDIGTCYAGERYVRADLTELDAMVDLLDGADCVVHFGAIGDEAPFETLLGPNFIGAYNVWEAAHRNNLGYRPQDNAEQFAEAILAEAPAADINDLAQLCHGGPFASVELGNSGLASMDIVDDSKTT